MTSNDRAHETDTCRDPGAVTRDDLVAYAGGLVDDRIAAHLASCAACRAAVEQYTRLDRALSARLFRADCPPALILGELALDLLSPEEALPVRTHLALCPHCAAEFSELTSVARTDPLLAAGSGHLRRIIARLLPTGGRQLGAVALRGAPESGTRTYSADGLTVSLSVGLETAGPPRRWSLVGLLVDEGGDDLPLTGTAVLRQRDHIVAEAALNEIEGMTFTGLAKGTYRLEVALDDRLIVVEDVRVGDDPGP